MPQSSTWIGWIELPTRTSPFGRSQTPHNGVCASPPNFKYAYPSKVIPASFQFLDQIATGREASLWIERDGDHFTAQASVACVARTAVFAVCGSSLDSRFRIRGQTRVFAICGFSN
jgi:hypothetical protein